MPVPWTLGTQTNKAQTSVVHSSLHPFSSSQRQSLIVCTVTTYVESSHHLRRQSLPLHSWKIFCKWETKSACMYNSYKYGQFSSLKRQSLIIYTTSANVDSFLHLKRQSQIVYTTSANVDSFLHLKRQSQLVCTTTNIESSLHLKRQSLLVCLALVHKSSLHASCSMVSLAWCVRNFVEFFFFF